LAGRVCQSIPIGEYPYCYQEERQMKNLNWFKYRQYLGYVIDLARIFPIINKQRGVSKLLAGISSHIFEAPFSIWAFLQNLEMSFVKIFIEIIPSCFSKLILISLY